MIIIIIIIALQLCVKVVFKLYIRMDIGSTNIMQLTHTVRYFNAHLLYTRLHIAQLYLLNKHIAEEHSNEKVTWHFNCSKKYDLFAHCLYTYARIYLIHT